MALGLTFGTLVAGFILHFIVFSLRKNKPTTSLISGRVPLFGFFLFVTTIISLFGWATFNTANEDGSDWPSTYGTLTVFEVEAIDRERGASFNGDVTDPLHLVRLEYTYRVEGTEYTGHRRIVNEQLRDGYLELEEDELDSLNSKYAIGDSVEVIYDPDDPANSALERGNNTPFIALGAGAGTVGGILAGIFAFPVSQSLLRRKLHTSETR